MSTPRYYRTRHTGFLWVIAFLGLAIGVLLMTLVAFVRPNPLPSLEEAIEAEEFVAIEDGNPSWTARLNATISSSAPLTERLFFAQRILSNATAPRQTFNHANLSTVPQVERDIFLALIAAQPVQTTKVANDAAAAAEAINAQAGLVSS